MRLVITQVFDNINFRTCHNRAMYCGSIDNLNRSMYLTLRQRYSMLSADNSHIHNPVDAECAVLYFD
jgi:hypothetical protein